MPFDVIGADDSGEITIEFELLHIPELDDDKVRGDVPNPLRPARLLALAEILLLRSSRSNDFNGDTLL